MRGARGSDRPGNRHDPAGDGFIHGGGFTGGLITNNVCPMNYVLQRWLAEQGYVRHHLNCMLVKALAGRTDARAAKRLTLPLLDQAEEDRTGVCALRAPHLVGGR